MGRRARCLEWCDLHHSTIKSVYLKPLALTLRKKNYRLTSTGMSTLRSIMVVPVLNRLILNSWTTPYLTFCLYQKVALPLSTTDKAAKTLPV
jgi:hypothetical protein